MTREEAMTKLLALGEQRFEDLMNVCGWPVDEVRNVLQVLTQSGRVTWNNAGRARWYRLARADS